ncbi:hypothetical protein V6C27_01150 [Peptococcaceae bacterium 1198_IL3148]
MSQPKIYIKTPKEKVHKLIKWYGWITIILLCITPLVFLLLPVLMVNTNKINGMLRESQVLEEDSLAGTVKEANWETDHDSGVHYIKGMLQIENSGGEIVECKFFKYIGPDQKVLPDILVDDNVEMTGQFKTDDNIFAVRNIRNLRNDKVYTTKPSLRMY